MIVDFHSHTLESDGTLAPADLVAAMTKRGVQIFSISDHDTLGAYDRIDVSTIAATVVTGIELNSTYGGREVHILGYGFPLTATALGAAIAENRRERIARAERMVAQLKGAGYDIAMADIRAQAGHGESTIGRPHVARALVRSGYVADVESAFRQLLTPGKPGYVPSLYLTPQRAVELVVRAGGVPVLAHPGRLHDESIVEELVELGLLGIEVFYPTHSAGQIAHFRNLATQYGLVMTAGSDFHDSKYTPRGVGMDVDPADIAGFLELVS